MTARHADDTRVMRARSAGGRKLSTLRKTSAGRGDSAGPVDDEDEPLCSDSTAGERGGVSLGV